MSRDLLKTAKEVEVLARKYGAQGSRVSVWQSQKSQVEWRDGKLDRIRDNTRLSVNLTLFVDGRYSSHQSSDLRPEGLRQFVERAIAMTKHLARDPHRRLAPPSRYTGRFQGNLELVDAGGYQALDASEQRKEAKALEEAVRAAARPNTLISATGSCGLSRNESAMVTSNGMEGMTQGTSFFRYAVASVKDQGSRKPNGWFSHLARQRNRLPSIEVISQQAYRRAMEQLGAGPKPSGNYACVIENRILGNLVSWLFQPLSGNAIQQQRSFLADTLGHTIAGPIFSITDDPHLPGGQSSGTYDGEGMSTTKRRIIEAGTLKHFFLDTYYASKLSKEPTTGGPSNLVFQTGTRSLPQLLSDMGRGLLITGFSGGNSNGATGDFSVGITGMWVEGGVATSPVSEMNLTGNHLSFWKRIKAVGNDPYLSSAWRCPSIFFDEVQCSGMDRPKSSK